MNITIDLNYFQDISKETALVGADSGYSMGRQIKIKNSKTYIIKVPDCIITINGSYFRGLISGLKYKNMFFDPKQLVFDNPSFQQRYTDYLQRQELYETIEIHSKEDSDFGAICSLIHEVNSLDSKMEQKGFISSQDIDNLNVFFFIKWILFISYYTSWDYDVFYMVDNVKYSEFNLVPQEKKSLAKTCFEYSEDYISS